MFGFKNEWKGAWHDTMSGTKMLLDVNTSLKNKKKKIQQTLNMNYKECV